MSVHINPLLGFDITRLLSFCLCHLTLSKVPWVKKQSSFSYSRIHQVCALWVLFEVFSHPEVTKIFSNVIFYWPDYCVEECCNKIVHRLWSQTARAGIPVVSLLALGSWWSRTRVRRVRHSPWVKNKETPKNSVSQINNILMHYFKKCLRQKSIVNKISKF